MVRAGGGRWSPPSFSEARVAFVHVLLVVAVVLFLVGLLSGRRALA
jgi:hypothetical protein